MKNTHVLYSNVLFLFLLLVLLLVLTTTSFADTFTVTNLNDLGPGSLRQAVIDANNNPNPPGEVDEIAFNILGLPGTITLATGEMTITDAVKIFGPGIRMGLNSNGRFFRNSRIYGN